MSGHARMLCFLASLHVCSVMVPAATILLNVVPVGGEPGDTVVLAPGERIEFEIQAVIVPDELTDPVDPFFAETTGLISFDLGVTSDLGVPQSPLTDFGPIIGPNFPFGQSLGTTEVSGSILDITASQNFTNFPVRPGVAVGETETLGTGTLITPDTEGTFSVQVEGDIQILDPETGLIAPPATTDFGSGFIIRTQADPEDEDDTDEEGEVRETLRDDDREGLNAEELDFSCAPMNVMMPAAMLGWLSCLRIRHGRRKWRR